MIKFNDSKGETRTISFHETIDTLPIQQYQLVQKFSLIDLGVGSNIHDINRHMSRFDQLLETKDYDSIALERQNLHINFGFILDSQVIPLYMLSAMTQSLDNEPISIKNSNDVDKIYALLETSDISYGVVRNTVENQKKSLVTS